jgi:vacuolar-type H+-ATPase subunit H
MDVMALIDRIEEAMDTGRSLPLMRGRLVDIEKVYEIIDEIRGNFPDELKQARWIVKERQEMLEEAEKEANRILEEARDRADAMASEQEVVRRAAEQAATILDDARQQEREIRLGAEDYADVQRGRDRLQGKVNQRQ